MQNIVSVRYLGIISLCVDLSGIENSYDFFLSTIDNVSLAWTVDVQVNSIPICFKIDMDVDVTAIPLNDFQKLDNVTLQLAKKDFMVMKSTLAVSLLPH